MTGLCDGCFHRQDSKKRCREYLEEGRTGMILDPQPKAECKWHTLYGEERDHQKEECRDFRPGEECVDPNAPEVPCAVCGKPVRTCERKEPVPIPGPNPDLGRDYTCPAHPDGYELPDGKWVCSEECGDGIAEP